MTLRRVLAALSTMLCIALLSLGIYFVYWGMVAAAVATAQTGREVLDRMHALNVGERAWADCSQDMAITITNQRGGEQKRSLTFFTKKFPADGEDARRTIVFFTEPKDVDGMSVLQWSRPHAEDQQWLYLPALKRVRQISGGSKSDSFAGTHLSYEDVAIINQIADWSESDASVRLLGFMEEDEEEIATLELIPTGKKVVYTRILMQIRTKDLVMWRLQFFSSAQPIKVISFEDIRVLGKIPTAHIIKVIDERSHGTTIVKISDVAYDLGLKEDLFSQRSLERGPMK